MADPVSDWTHRGGFAGLSRRIGSGEGLKAVERAGLAAATVIARRGKAADAATALGRMLGAPVVDGGKRTSGGDVTVLGTGPGTWLVFGDRPALVADLTAALDGLAAVVDQSDANAILDLSGPRLVDVLEKGLRLDLHPAAFAADDVAVTAIAHVGVTLWMSDDRATVTLAIPRSLAGSLLHWLEASARPVGLTVEAD
ncbi:sarcosine oxidase subunit gamma family protein [Phreatobacter sp.]|uniref:sarcosine oxidase subunit gamma n=1 Tax=Phreatobacter sp. TaxID=1966341 RepID=UPI0022C5E476|nr:sarcosine oxidase subunit gamma family protein [Phreatobacter sp.]MCZ8316931.1 sarcosine oxidase subunit gamma [Phreatobacter sp.]